MGSSMQGMGGGMSPQQMMMMQQQQMMGGGFPTNNMMGPMPGNPGAPGGFSPGNTMGGGTMGGSPGMQGGLGPQMGGMGGQQGPLGPDCDMVEKIGNGIGNRLHNMKASYKMFQDFVKLSMNYMNAIQGASAAGRQMAAVLKKVSTGQGQPDIAAGFRQLAEMQHSTESRQDQVIKVIQNDLLSSAQNVLTGGFKETCRFEQGFMQGYEKAKNEIRQLQLGSPQRSAKVREVEDKLANNLEILKGLERKVYCNFLLLWTAVLDAQTA